jgi:hypothetical protein
MEDASSATALLARITQRTAQIGITVPGYVGMRLVGISSFIVASESSIAQPILPMKAKRRETRATKGTPDVKSNISPTMQAQIARLNRGGHRLGPGSRICSLTRSMERLDPDALQ